MLYNFIISFFCECKNNTINVFFVILLFHFHYFNALIIYKIFCQVSTSFLMILN